jgi:HSP20 family protein
MFAAYTIGSRRQELQEVFKMTSLVTYRPTSILADMERALDSLFDDGFATTSGGINVDVREEDGRYVLEAELPGLSEKDIEVKVENDMLTLASKREDSREEKRNGYVLRERSTRGFSRSFVLPNDVDREHIQARLENGLLVMELPKTEAAKPRQIEVKKA